MSTSTCPIWGTPATRLAGYDGRDGYACHSPRAGGSYFISRSAIHDLSDTDTKIKITHEIVDHNLVGSVPEILASTIESLGRIPRPTPQQRADRLLRLLVKMSPHLGAALADHRALSIYDDPNILSIGIASTPAAGPLFAHSDSQFEDEVIFILQMLEAEGAVKLGGGGAIPEITVMPLGYAKYEKAVQAAAPEQAFVAMWFDESMERAYAEGISLGVHDAGYRPLRIDQKEHVNKIDDEIISEIRRSHFIIADFTSDPHQPRGGVYFEAGLAYGLSKPVIWSCRADLIGHVHFDTRQFNHIVWRDPEGLRVALRNRIGALLGDGPLR